MYEHLYKCIRNDILEGNLKSMEKLPSKRAFAKNLGISVITVENAYEQLIAEGYVYSIPKKGFYVSDLKEAGMPEKRRSESLLTAGRTAETLEKTSSWLADFVSNQTDSRIFPFTIWAKTMREVLSNCQNQLMVNAPCGGILELRAAIAEYLGEFRGMRVGADQIVVGAGTEYLYGLLIQLLGKDLVYGVEDPGYPKIGKIYQSMKVACKFLPMDADGVRTDALEKEKVDVMHLSPAHHFPTGTVMPISRRYELLGWAARQPERYLIEDDYDSELRLSGRPIPTLQSIDVADKVIYINTFSKTLASTVRISYMVLPPGLTKRFYRELSFYSCTVSNFEQYTLAAFMRNGSFEKHINRLRNYYQHKRDAILGEFEKGELGGRITILEEEAGVHFLMQVKTDRAEAEILSRAQKLGIRLAPLSGYFAVGEHGRKAEEMVPTAAAGSAGRTVGAAENIYVMNYSSIDPERVEKIAAALYRAIV